MKPNAQPNRADDPGQPDAIERAAADWLILHDRGLTSAQAAEFARWRAADARHADVFDEVEETWRLLHRVRDSAPVEKVEAVERAPRRRSRKLLWLPAALAAAAALALAVWWPTATRVTDSFSEIAATEAGTLKKVELPDGSVLQLNASSAVEIQFTKAERRVRLLRGELHLDVAKNPARPFIVSAGQVAVQAVGTAFDVNLRPGETVEVLVTEGRVRVDDTVRKQSLLTTAPGGEPPLLVAGQRARIVLASEPSVASPPATVVAVAPAEIAEAQAWRTRQLQFVSVPLAEMVSEFNRYNRHQLVIDDARLAAQHFGGTFLAGDYETFVRLLDANFGVRAERRPHETVLRLAR